MTFRKTEKPVKQTRANQRRESEREAKEQREREMFYRWLKLPVPR